ncbi:MAG TPA: glycosyltransferase family 2 protein [Acidobacteriaceae bacterium]|nr:glycosyltransferase family 2 protein [Acidobacteriaceae bacterium]
MNDTPSSPITALENLGNHVESLRLSVIVPARNEERCLAKCLESLVSQSEETFWLGREWELIVVDDGSTDRTREIAEGFQGYEGVRVLEAPALDLSAETRVFTGKTNACWFGAEAARGRFLLFTDADTVHEAGDLLRALEEIQARNVGLLSYSPRQVVSGFWQRALMPLVFSELASVYKMAEVNDTNKRLAAANGQFLMVGREAYFAVGGHRGVGRSVLEDVELAYAVKRAGKGIWFRYAPDALSTRMYFGFSDMVEGWTKNLALLFPHALTLAAWRLLDIGLLMLPILLIPLRYLAMWQQGVILLIWARTLLRYYTRVRRSNFSPLDCAVSVFALPLFVGLLVWSWVRHRVLHAVAWKGREYRI